MPQYDPFLKIQVDRDGQEVPVPVFAHILNYLQYMATEDHAYFHQVAEGFEESTITVGLTVQEEAEAIEYHCDPEGPWEVPEGYRPVAQWNSGLSIGCSQTLYVHPALFPTHPDHATYVADEGTYYWTEP